MNILVVGNYYYPEHMGGVEVVSYNLVKYYRKYGHYVRWLAADVPPKYRNIQVDDVPIKAWNFSEEHLGFPHPIPFPNVLFILFRQIKWCNIVHIQDTLYPINMLTFVMAKIMRKPILITQYAKIIQYREFYKRALQILTYKTLGWVIFTTADKVVFITTNVRDNMKNFTLRKHKEVVPLGVNVDFFAPLKENVRNELRKKLTGDAKVPIVLFVGRMVERKGVHLILPLVEKHKNWHWVFVGRPDDYNPGEWQNVNMTYFQTVSNEELRNLYAIADVLIHPSSGEGITLIISECMACGTPVVASKESLYEIDNKDFDLFYSVKPETSNIDITLSSALNNQSRLRDLRIKTREFAENRLSWEKVSLTYLSIIKQLIEENK